VDVVVTPDFVVLVVVAGAAVVFDVVE
jgi:hypothetical protein